MLKKIRLLSRLIYIQWIFVRYRLDVFLNAIPFLRPVHWGMRLLFLGRSASTKEPRAIRLRLALERLGPVFIKFGQNLSTRRDLLDPDLADELAKLQDSVPPFDSLRARGIIEKSLGKPLDNVFSFFEEEPLASASIAQVHRATLHTGEAVVVKVVRPDIKKVIDRDLSILELLANLAHRYWKESRRLKPKEVVAEYDRVIHDELDLVREAANASQLKRNFDDSPLLYVPEVYWAYTRKHVMVMEEIKGIAIDDVDALRDKGIDLKTLSENGVEIFYTQVFRDNFFHADMHPGNIFAGENGQYLAVDFGIMGSLSHDDQHYLAENFLAFFNRDYRRVAELHVASGWVPAHTRVEEFESAIRTVCEPIFERPLKDISFGRLLLQLFVTVRRFDMEIQPQLLLLQKTLLNIEGLGRQLYPDLDLWKTAKPFLERWMKERIGFRAAMDEFKKNSVDWGEQLPQIPGLLFQALKKINDREDDGYRYKYERNDINSKQNKYVSSLAYSIITGAFLFSGTMILLAERETYVMLAYGCYVVSVGFALLTLRNNFD